MKKVALFLAGLFLLSLSWMAFVRVPLPPVPAICGELSEEVAFHFTINTMDYTGLEMALANKVDGKGMHVQFRMANAWKTGRPGLVIKGIKQHSDFKGGMSPDQYLDDQKRKNSGKKDFSDFMKDSNGRSVSSYTFRQALVEGEDGKTYMRMTYDGPAMEMIQTLEIPRPVTLPAHISRQFTPEGIIQFQPGTVALDDGINGFYIPVVVR